MKRQFLFIFACLVLAKLAGSAETLSPSIKPEDLLSAAYPQWNGRFDSSPDKAEPIRLGPINLPTVNWPWGPADVTNHSGEVDADATTVDIVPMSVIRLDDQHAVMVTRALQTNPMGANPSCSTTGCTYAIGAYFFTQSESKWKLTKRQEVVDTAHSSLSPAQAHVDRWPGHGVLFSIRMPSYYRSDTNEWVLLMGLEPDRVTFSRSISLSEDITNDDENCTDALLIPNREPKRNTGYGDSLDCRRAKGNFKIDGDSILIDYEQSIRKANSNGRLLPLDHSRTSVKLIPSNGKLIVVFGTLPEFGF
jgi:hypothetical protein